MLTRTSAWLVTVLGAVMAAATFAPSASADTQRYASPTGSGTACSVAAPCAITQAMASATAGDEVIVSPGDYHLPAGTGLFDPAQITIHGMAGKPRPRLLFSGLGQTGLALIHGSTLRYVEIDQAAGALALYARSSSVEQVIAKGATDWQCTAEIDNGTIRNSVVVGPGANQSVLCTVAYYSSSVSSYRNVTAVATSSGGVAVEAFAGNSMTAAINLINVIAKGGAGGAGLEIHTDDLGATATIKASNSNFANYWTVGSHASYVDGGGNQGTPPYFVSPATGDYRQAPGSMTIGAGLDSPDNDAFDFEGDPRAVGTTDIGADEFVPAPAATTGAAGAVTNVSATLNASVAPNGAPTSYRFEYGPTTAYGSSTPIASAGSGMGPGEVSAAVGGFSPATTYHFRVVATNAGGTTRGADQTVTTGSAADQTFTTGSAPDQTSTTAPPASPSGGPTAPPTRGFAGVKLLSTRLTVARGLIALKLGCPSGTVGRCTGRTALTVRRRSGAPVTLGRARFSIAAGSCAKLRVRVSRAGRRLLGRVGRLRGRDTNTAGDGAGQAKTTVAAVSIRRRHP